MKVGGGNLRPLPLNDSPAEIQRGIRENAKIVDGIRDLTTIRTQDSPKSWHGMRYWTPVQGSIQ